jgi:transcriptional regulator with XRE-family HTH domain
MHSVTSLGEFIRARRAATTPAQVGLSEGGPRRTTGLRREEVAALAGLSEGYYARLEQGREKYPSNQVLDALIRVLQLDLETAEHLYRLARTKCRPRVAPSPEVSPDVLRMIDNWKLPASVSGPRLDILANNAAGAALLSPMGEERNTAKFMFLNPASEEFNQDRQELMRWSVSILRASADLYAGDPLLTLIDELASQSREFRKLWDRYDVHVDTLQYKRLVHPVVGELELKCQHFAVPGAPGQRLVVWQPEPDSPSQEALDFLHVSSSRAE